MYHIKAVSGHGLWPWYHLCLRPLYALTSPPSPSLHLEKKNRWHSQHLASGNKNSLQCTHNEKPVQVSLPENAQLDRGFPEPVTAVITFAYGAMVGGLASIAWVSNYKLTIYLLSFFLLNSFVGERCKRQLADRSMRCLSVWPGLQVRPRSKKARKGLPGEIFAGEELFENLWPNKHRQCAHDAGKFYMLARIQSWYLSSCDTSVASVRWWPHYRVRRRLCSCPFRPITAASTQYIRARASVYYPPQSRNGKRHGNGGQRLFLIGPHGWDWSSCGSNQRTSKAT